MQDLAEMSGVHAGTLSRLEAGKRRAQVATVAKLADALGLTIEALEGSPAAANPTGGNGAGGADQSLIHDRPDHEGLARAHPGADA